MIDHATPSALHTRARPTAAAKSATVNRMPAPPAPPWPLPLGASHARAVPGLSGVEHAVGQCLDVDAMQGDVVQDLGHHQRSEPDRSPSATPDGPDAFRNDESGDEHPEPRPRYGAFRHHRVGERRKEERQQSDHDVRRELPEDVGNRVPGDPVLAQVLDGSALPAQALVHETRSRGHHLGPDRALLRRDTTVAEVLERERQLVVLGQGLRRVDPRALWQVTRDSRALDVAEGTDREERRGAREDVGSPVPATDLAGVAHVLVLLEVAHDPAHGMARGRRRRRLRRGHHCPRVRGGGARPRR